MQKHTLIYSAVLLAISIIAGAQIPAAANSQAIEALEQMTPEQQEEMRKAMVQMAECMSHVNAQEQQALQQRALKVSNEIDTLCESGKTQEARQYAEKEGTEIMKLPVVKEIQKCWQQSPKKVIFDAYSVVGKAAENLCGSQ